MSELRMGVCVLLASVMISSVSQILLKKAANRIYKNPLAEYLNPLVIGAYAMFFGSVILTMIALKYVRFWNPQVIFLCLSLDTYF